MLVYVHGLQVRIMLSACWFSDVCKARKINALWIFWSLKKYVVFPSLSIWLTSTVFSLIFRALIRQNQDIWELFVNIAGRQPTLFNPESRYFVMKASCILVIALHKNFHVVLWKYWPTNSMLKYKIEEKNDWLWFFLNKINLIIFVHRIKLIRLFTLCRSSQILVFSTCLRCTGTQLFPLYHIRGNSGLETRSNRYTSKMVKSNLNMCILWFLHVSIFCSHHF